MKEEKQQQQAIDFQKRKKLKKRLIENLLPFTFYLVKLGHPWIALDSFPEKASEGCRVHKEGRAGVDA